MSDQFTPSQKEAIEYRDSSVIVSAGAGSGKTRVLTERLMKYIVEDNVDIDSFVVITFTKAAAAELKSRISASLRELGMRKQEALVERAQIGTIHHFCAEILRENAHSVHINPDFRIVSDERADEMKSAALDKVLEQRYKELSDNPKFESLVNSVGKGRTDEALVSLVLQLHAKMQCHPNPGQWAENVISELRKPVTDAGDTIWGDEILSGAIRTAQYWANKIDEVLLQIPDDAAVSKGYLETMSITAEGYREYIRNLKLGWDRAVSAPEIEYKRPAFYRNAQDAELLEKVKAVRDSSKKAYEKMRKTIGVQSSELLKEMETTSDGMEALLALVMDFDAEYAKDKRRLNYLDYNDLEHMTAAFLDNHDISDRYTEIMVDEYQDVSRVQDFIFHKVSDNGRKLFMVGDIKQSIYRFRLAEPEIFKEKCLSSDVHSILLRENFRSGERVISSINRLFEKIMTEELGDTDYTQNALVFGNAMEKDDSQDAKIILVNAIEDENKRQTEARTVADMIVHLNAEEKIAFGDIAVLLRTAGKTGDIFRNALTDRHVPVSFEQGGEFFDSPEISAMISILRIMDNPHNDIPLVAALRSPFFGFTPDELSEIRVCNKDEDFFTALRTHADSNEKSAKFLSTLIKLRTLAPDLSTDSMIRLIINETNAEIICALMRDGERRMSNLMQLVSLGVKYEKDGYHGLHRFIMYLDKLKEKNTAITSADDGDAVKIMSIHKSKGLEFKVVFVCDLEHEFNDSDSKDTVLVHPELGLGPKVTDRKRKIQYPTLARNAISLKERKELRSEEMRLMYVALTRAKERLFLTACVKDAEKAIAKAKNASLNDANNTLVWILNADTLETVITDAPDKDAENVVITPVLNKNLVAEGMVSDFAYKYRYSESVDIPSKINATELKHLDEENDDSQNLFQRGRTRKIHADGRKISAAERGSATHKVLQLMDFNNDVDAEIERLVRERFISPRQAQAADAEKIDAFLKSDTGRMVSCADNIRREFEFMLLYNAEEILGRGNDEKVLLRGVVDCCIEEEDGLVVIDYKTDRVSSDDEIGERIREYTPQLEIYSKSLERIFCKPVKDTILYFLSAGKAVSIGDV